MRIVKFKKVSNDKYKLYLDNGDIISLFEDVIVKNNLLMKKCISSEKIDDLINQNNEFDVYHTAIKYITIKMRSKLELKNYLIKKQTSEELINSTINRLSKEGYINDLLFAKAFINDQVNLSFNGPLKIKRKLLEHGVEEEICNNEIAKIDEGFIKEKLSKLLKKQLRIKTGSANLVKIKLLNYFINLGYEKSMILNELSKVCIKTDDKKLKREYEKLYNKYKDKYDKEKLTYVLSSKLYLKGYTKEEVKSIISGK